MPTHVSIPQLLPISLWIGNVDVCICKFSHSLGWLWAQFAQRNRERPHRKAWTILKYARIEYSCMCIYLLLPIIYRIYNWAKMVLNVHQTHGYIFTFLNFDSCVNRIGEHYTSHRRVHAGNFKWWVMWSLKVELTFSSFLFLLFFEQKKRLFYIHVWRSLRMKCVCVFFFLRLLYLFYRLCDDF